jgi:hypothetical protein
MAGTVQVVWDSAAVKLWTESPGSDVGRVLEVFAAQVQQAMKAACPVSPVMPVYAQPVPLGSSKGQAYAGRRIGKGLAWPGGPDVSRTRYPGDLPLRPSGYLRSSIVRVRAPDGSWLIGPTAPYASYVNDGTPPHGIDSTGPWPLRNRASGQVFGPHVNHPGTAPAHFIERAAESIAGRRVAA